MTSWISVVLVRCCAGIGFVLALAVAPALGQAAASTGLSGRVTDSTGAALPGVSVTIANLDTGGERVVATNEPG